MENQRASAGNRRASFAYGCLYDLGHLFLWVVTVAAAVMAVWNVLGPMEEVQQLAGESACKGEPAGCTARMTMWERRPWVQSISMTTPRATKTVSCGREYILYGPWSCSAIDTGAAPTPPSAKTIWITLPASAAPAPPKAKGKPGPTPAPSASP